MASKVRKDPDEKRQGEAEEDAGGAERVSHV